MGNFSQHLRYGVATHIVSVLPLTVAAYLGTISIITWLAGTALIPLTVSGAIFPDIDHHSSKPNTIFKYILFVIFSLMTGFIYGRYMWDTVDLRPAVFGASCSFLSLLAGVVSIRLFSLIRPKHRGVTHRVPTGLFLSVVTASGVWYIVKTLSVSSPFLAPVCGSLFFVGFLSHLKCDKMLSQKKTYFTLS